MMGASIEANRLLTREQQTSFLRKPSVLRLGHLRLSLDTEGSVRFLESLSERRLLFGRERLIFYKIKAGILVQGQRADWKVNLTPGEAIYSVRLLDSIDVTQRIRILPNPVEGYVRTLLLRNVGTTPARLRLLSVHDPTAAHFREGLAGWGSLGVNAFNRSSHVAMDEVTDSPAARVIGTRPEPRLIYMTAERARAAELLLAGELPEQIAGMSGQVIVLCQHDLEIQSMASCELTMLSLYDPRKLEGALSSFDKFLAGQEFTSSSSLRVNCSSPAVTAAASWALSALEGIQCERDQLDRYEVLKTLPLVDPAAAESIFEGAKQGISKDGSVGHSSDLSQPGLLETSALLEGAAVLGLLSPEKKYARSLFPIVRKLAGRLLASSADGIVRTDGSLPQGWRRRIGKGYPAGEIPELSLAVAAALSRAASFASRMAKPNDSAVWQERSKLVVESVKRRALDEHGSLVLSMEGERQRQEVSVDQVVACYKMSPDSSIVSHIIRRLLEKDFETGWGPRTIPTSNRIYFNPSYGDGQLGGYWTRTALAHAVAAYAAGHGVIGSIELENVSRLPLADAAKLGGSPGDFPYWIDTQRREAHGPGSDPVAAVRFLEALTRGELGLDVGAGGISFSPGLSSRLRWLLLSGLNLGKKTSIFLGRAAGKAHVFADVPGCATGLGWSFSGAEAGETEDGRVSVVSFFSPGQTTCVGNQSDAMVKTKVSFRPRDPVLTRHLSANLLRLDPSTESWTRVSTVRILSAISFDVALGPSEWNAFRIATSS